uniref:Uncharacterized protein n=1 Tax=Arundo donax TaxID=35708 RepID=A0A0A9HSA3_ARUDO
MLTIHNGLNSWFALSFTLRTERKNSHGA